ncbi:MAG: hypothetical protein JRN06_10080 [Nitrososphaerota archaeon]|nr:hypothetical protein [Nitrososphaerota archaeon]MDG7024935.1 hypothetical protein [Nitrososphaerota archaeon]
MSGNPGLLRNGRYLVYNAEHAFASFGYSLYTITIPAFSCVFSGSILFTGLTLFVEYGIYSVTFLAGPIVDRVVDKRRVLITSAAIAALALPQGDAQFFYAQASPAIGMRFEETREFEGDASEVWKRASAISEIPKYWHGTRTLEVVSESGGAAHVKIKFAFGGSGEADVIADGEKRMLTIDYTSGPFTGKQTVEVGDGQVIAKWDVKFKGVFRVASRWNEGHFRSGTVHALERLTAPGSQA